MKSTTQIWIALRNIGDSQDLGVSHEAPLSQAILWLATQLSKISMAGRIVIGIGRTQEDALRGISVKGTGKAALDEDMKALLESVFSGEMDSDEAEHRQAGLTNRTSSERIAGDDYVA